MDFTISLFSNGYLTSNSTTDWATATVSRDLWEQIYRQETSLGNRHFIRFEAHERTVVVAIGRPSMEANELSEEANKVYIDNMFIQRLGLYGDGEIIRVTIFTQEAFPEATRIVIRSVDSAIYNSNVKQELEHALTHLGLLEKHVQYQVPIQALGNFPIDIFISELEPAHMVLCHGDDIVIEFEEPVDQITPPPPSPERPPTPIPVQPMPLLNTSSETSGRVLGSDPTIQPPAWRQQLGPPRPPRNA